MSPGRRRRENRGPAASGGGAPGRRREEPRGDGRASLKHEVALVVSADGSTQEIRAPHLKEECSGDPNHPLAREVIDASRAGNLRCPVCASVVERVFPNPESSVERWHFRRRAGEGECDHEGETVAHREAKEALAAALAAVLEPEGWEVLLEHRLENGRRPDVLAVHESGVRVAFEVQYSNIPRPGGGARQRDYAALGVTAYWFLGAETRYERSRDDLRAALEAEPGQRVIYVGRFADGEGKLGPIEAREFCLSYLDPAAPPDLQGYKMLAPPADLAHLTPERRGALKAAQKRKPLAFSLGKLGLRLLPAWLDEPEGDPPDGAVLVSPLDAQNEKMAAEGRRRQRERSAEQAAEKDREARAKEETRRAVAAVLAGWERDEAEWVDSEERAEAEAVLGTALVEDLESEELRVRVFGEPVRRVCRTGGWRVEFFLRELEPRRGGRPFVWSEVVDAYLDSGERGIERAPGPADSAWRDLRKRLVGAGLVRPRGSPEKDRWVVRARVPSQEPLPRPGAEPQAAGPGRLRRLFGRFFSSSSS